MQKKFASRGHSRANKRSESVLRSTYISGIAKIEPKISPPLSPSASPLKISSSGSRMAPKIEIVDERNSSVRSLSH